MEYTTLENVTIHCKNHKWKIIPFKFSLIDMCKPKTLSITYYSLLYIVTYLIF